MITLAIDASTYRGTVAVFRERTIIATGEAAMRGADTEALMPTVVTTLAAAGIGPRRINRVICGAGPGSFTSLRIAAGIAKGMALGSNAPLYAVSSLGLVLAASSAPPGTYLVTLDALRDEWYAAVYERSADARVTELRPMVRIAKDVVKELGASVGATVIGAATGTADPHAAGCYALADTIERSGPVDLDRWEPSYGRLAEAQVKWEVAHGRPLASG